VTRAQRPLEALAREVGGREARNLALIEAPGAPAEIAPLVAETNQLLMRLARSFDNERRFTGDAAHELRTPLAALRTQAEVALTTASDDRRRRALEQVVAGVERATRLVEQMLLLARLDAADLTPAFAPVDLAKTCREAMADAAARARDRNVEVALDAQGELVVPGDPVMLLALARNLVDNAARYAPDSGQVRVTLRREERSACLSVEDAGPGVPPEQRERIFERFYRGTEGRGEGSGLGLSIVRRVVELHGGSLGASSSPALGGLRVEVRLPLQP
jgi:two-component system sensor histidine kinase QseC